jgi:predicted nucleotidyltransferase
MQNVPDFNDTDFKKLFDRVIEDLKSHPKIVGISLHGSLVSGEQDEFSDIDLDIFLWRDWEDLEQMRNDFERLVKSWPKPDPEVLKKRRYALNLGWEIRIVGKYLFDFNFEPVEAFTRPRIEKVLSCEEVDTLGIIDLVQGEILYDPRGLLAEFKRKLKTYPQRLSERIVKKRLFDLHVDYFMFKASAGRRNVSATSLFLARFFEDAGHLLFALNRRWHPGQKRLAKSLAKLKILPPDYISLMERTLNPITLHQWDNLEKIIERIYFGICSLSESK